MIFIASNHPYHDHHHQQQPDEFLVDRFLPSFGFNFAGGLPPGTSRRAGAAATTFPLISLAISVKASSTF